MKLTLNEVKAMNKGAGTQMTAEQEIAFIKNRLQELEFDSKKELDDYRKSHKVRKGTELKVRSTKDKIVNKVSKGAGKLMGKMDKAYDKFSNTKAGKSLNKGLDWVAKKVQGIDE